MTCFTILHLQINYVTFCTHDCKIWLLFMFLFIRYVAARIYKNLSGDLSRCYVDRTGGRIASYSALPHPTLLTYVCGGGQKQQHAKHYKAGWLAACIYYAVWCADVCACVYTCAPVVFVCTCVHSFNGFTSNTFSMDLYLYTYISIYLYLDTYIYIHISKLTTQSCWWVATVLDGQTVFDFLNVSGNYYYFFNTRDGSDRDTDSTVWVVITSPAVKMGATPMLPLKSPPGRLNIQYAHHHKQ